MAFDGVIGKSAKCYYNTATYTTPTWVEIKRAVDVSADLSKIEVPVAMREVDWQLTGAGLKEASVEMTYVHKPGADTVFDALLDMYISDTSTDMVFMDGAVATSNNQGLRAYFICFGMGREEDLNGLLVHSFSFKPTLHDDSGTLRNPQWWEAP